jgi:cellulose synthase operon protein C
VPVSTSFEEPAVDVRDADRLRALRDRLDPADAGAFNNLGVLYFTKGLHADAIDVFLRALTIAPRMRTAARNLEIAAQQPGACDGRRETLQARLADDPDDREARYALAQLARLTGDVTDARRQLDALIAEDPDDPRALTERGLVEQRTGDLRRAQRWFERAVNAAGGRDALRLLAEVHYQRGQNEQALAVLDTLLGEHADDAEAHRLRGFVLGDMGYQDAAHEAAARAATLDPSLDAVGGDLQLAAPGAVMRVDPDGAHAHVGLGLAFRQRGYLREARLEFERAAAAGEDPQLVTHALAELDLLDGESTSARERYQHLLTRDGRAVWWNELGVAWHQAGSLDEAAAAYRQALHRDPRSPRGRTRWHAGPGPHQSRGGARRVRRAADRTLTAAGAGDLSAARCGRVVRHGSDVGARRTTGRCP